MTTESSPRITASQTVALNGTRWTASQLGDGNYMLKCSAPDVGFDAHFTADDWRDFLGLVLSLAGTVVTGKT